jgi:monofunctional glycosyltransferase
MINRLLRYAVQSMFACIAISLLLVVLYRFVPVPYTLTMALDPNPVTKDWTPLSRVDKAMVTAVIAAEDGKFCLHNGFDTEAIEQALEENAEGGRIRGGSTISQQTAKNVFLWQGGGWFRKGLEAWFTFLIENLWDKRRIMEVYLNVAETGIGTYGVEAGSQRYFNHSASSMSRSEAARLAAALPLPKERPVVNPTGWTRRYGNMINARMGQIRRDGLDACVYS